ncbi:MULTISPECIES: cation:proton antiporter domain-containing protein [Arthrobacter]|uniref:cation:proton antiporter domain-containing protein n=1 Tax=Arthrobacter TaxID=1663 RepID=UPI0008369D3E|nr:MULTISPECIES: cation:proton antiporter [Arthrobacter]UPO78583.1 cation:proton antiporter [Arthrobacter sp. Helios]
MIALLLAAIVLITVSAFSGPLARRGVTSAMAFLLAGLILGAALDGSLGLGLENAAVLGVAELALVFLLFTDAARVDLGLLRRSIGWPGRLLTIGLPLTLLLGFGAGLLIFPGLPLASAFLLSAMLCATDAALGHRVVEDPAVPGKVRQALNVESGLNDGIAVPFFLVSLDISMSALEGGVRSAVVVAITEQIGWGMLAGVVMGGAGGYILRVASSRAWFQQEWRQPGTLAVAVGAYAAAVSLGGSAFLAAFVAGLAYRLVKGSANVDTSYFTGEVGSTLAAATWMIFGAVAVLTALPHITWQVLAYALLSLTVVRMLPVAVAMIGSGAQWQTKAFMGWFGPRGLASVVFALLAFERGPPAATTLLTTVVVTVGLSVFAHGLSAKPLIAAYQRWAAASPGK